MNKLFKLYKKNPYLLGKICNDDEEIFNIITQYHNEVHINGLSSNASVKQYMVGKYIIQLEFTHGSMYFGVKRDNGGIDIIISMSSLLLNHMAKLYILCDIKYGCHPYEYISTMCDSAPKRVFEILEFDFINLMQFYDYYVGRLFPLSTKKTILIYDIAVKLSPTASDIIIVDGIKIHKSGVSEYITGKIRDVLRQHPTE